MEQNAELHSPKRVAKSGVTYAVALIFQKILSFAYFSMVARALGPQKLGLYIFVLSFAAFFNLFVDFGFVTMAIRTFSQDSKKHLVRHFQSFFTIRIGFALVGFAILHACAFFFGYDSETRVLLLITSIIMVMDSFTAFFYALFRARQNLFYESIGTVLFQIIVVSTGLLVLNITKDLKALLIVILTGSLFHIVFSLFLLVKKIKIRVKIYFDQDLAKRWIIRAIPFFMAAGFLKAYNTIDSILIKNIAGDEAVGLYSIPAKIVFTFPFLAMAVSAAVYPAMSNYVKNFPSRIQPLFSRTIIILFAISMPIAVGISLLSDAIVASIWPEFNSSSAGLKILIWSIVFLYIEYPFGLLLNATGNEKQNTINRGIQLAAFCGMNLILIPLYGYMGAIYSSFVTSIIIVVLGWAKSRKIVSVFNKKTTISMLKLFIASFIMGICVEWLNGEYSFLVIIPIAAFVYFVIVLILKVFKKEDYDWFTSLIEKGQ